MKYCWFLLLLTIFACTDQPADTKPGNVQELSWEEITRTAQGSTVHMMMWQGDPLINDYMKEYVVPRVKEQFDINLQIANGQGNTIVQILMSELQAAKNTSELDLMWINGETFYQLRQIDGLFGPWTEKLPNAAYIDFDNPFIGVDFQQAVDGYECPWGNVQLALIYNSEHVQNPPQNMEELAAWVQENPGKFTFDTQFTGLTFLKSLLIAIAGGKEALNGPFDAAKYEQYSTQLWAYIRAIRPYLWKEGKTFPESVAPMHQMFANGELWFTMSNNDSEVDNKILQGLFPKAARAYALESGTIQNSHYLGISKLSGNKAGAMVVANFMISPEAQLTKQDPEVWGDGTILAMDKLPGDWKSRFQNLPNRKYAPPRAVLQGKALMELAPEYMIRLAADFRTAILEQ